MDRYTPTARERWQMKQSEPQPQGIIIIVLSSVAIGIGLLIFTIFAAQGFVEGLMRGYNEHYQSGR